MYVCMYVWYLKSVWDPARVIRLWGYWHPLTKSHLLSILMSLHSVRNSEILWTVFCVKKALKVGAVKNRSANLTLEAA